VKRLLNTITLTFFISISIFAAGRSDVADAAMKGDKAAIRTLVQQKADVNAPQADGATALHWAARINSVEILDLLLRAGARPNAPNIGR